MENFESIRRFSDIQKSRRCEQDTIKRQILKDFSVTSENRSSNITNGTKSIAIEVPNKA